MSDATDFPALVDLASRLVGKDKRTCDLALYTLKKQDERLVKRDARIAELKAALKPFATNTYIDEMPDWIDDGAVVGVNNVTVGELRAAHAALGEKE